MSSATLPPHARKFALLATLGLLAMGVAMGSAAPASAAKPCWERVIDDWVDNGRIDGVYSASCISEAREHVPEDLRTYTDIMDKLDAYRQLAGRSLPGSQSSESPTSPSGTEPGTTTTKPGTKQPEPNVEVGRDEGPIPYVLGKGTNDASSIPVPLLILAGLALALMAAGGAGFAYRKLQGRRNTSGD